MREVSKYFLCQNNGYKVDGNILQSAFIVLVNNNYKCQLIKFKKNTLKVNVNEEEQILSGRTLI